ncbi:MAG: NAD(P)-dependent alcohol dehydrogenase [bacterium]
MKAIIYRNFGSPTVLEPADLKKPIPKANEVLIKVKATTVTSADSMMRRGDTFFSRILLGFTRPKKKFQILGTEFSGIIESVGSNVTKFQTGDEIFAFRGFGTGCYAEYKCMNQNGSIALKPVNMSFLEAASLVDGASTAYFFLKEKANIQEGQKVLINGASGSIGTFAVQIAKYFGAEVTAVCSTKNLELVKSLGADKVIDYTKEDFTKTGIQYDIIFDTVGKSSFAKCKNVLNSSAKYVTTVMTLKSLLQSILTKFGNKKKVIFEMSINKTDALKFIKTLVEDGKLITIIDKQYPLKELTQAHTYVEKGHKQGNVVIEV